MSIAAEAQSIVLVHSVAETARLLGLSIAMLYLLFDSGELARIKVGRRTLIERREIDRFLAAHRVR